jgi:nitrite reductase/ring-hydroxylating ferredoxin subunit
MTEWHDVARADAVTEDEPVGVRVGDRYVGIFRVDGEIRALDDLCTHEFALLTNGFIEGHRVECPLHQACFDLRSGKCLTGPATRDLEVYPVMIEGGRVLVKLG